MIQAIFVDVCRGCFILVAVYGVFYFASKGWHNVENDTKKVCDMCFRDIGKVNNLINKK